MKKGAKKGASTQQARTTIADGGVIEGRDRIVTAPIAELPTTPAPTIPSLASTTVAQAAMAADKEKKEELRKKFPFALFFRTSFYSNLAQKNVDNSWQLPTQKDFLDQNTDKFSLKKGEDGCEFSLKYETAQFTLLNNNAASHEALSHSIASYVDTYGKWREKCEKKDDKSLDLIFELTVFTDNQDAASQIRPILASLEASGQTLSKVKVIDANNQVQELTKEQIEALSSKPKVSQPALA